MSPITIVFFLINNFSRPLYTGKNDEVSKDTTFDHSHHLQAYILPLFLFFKDGVIKNISGRSEDLMYTIYAMKESERRASAAAAACFNVLYLLYCIAYHCTDFIRQLQLAFFHFAHVHAVKRTIQSRDCTSKIHLDLKSVVMM